MDVKKNPEIEIGRNSSLYFAIGLILMLVLSWQALEHKTYEKIIVGVNNYEDNMYENTINDEDVKEEIPIISYAIQSAAPPPPAVVSESINIVEDNEIIEETIIESSEANQTTAINVYQEDATTNSTVPVLITDLEVDEVEEEVEVPFAVIEDAPVFPGCEGFNKTTMKDCFQDQIQVHVLKHFSYPEAALDLEIQGRVSVMFTIDSSGFISNIRSRGPDRLLEQEAERIIGLLPQMKPGKQRGKAVKVTYAIPIFFKYAEQ